uniref:Uncharacterized protein n=1 Tax=Fagus sylvatica TaxID=28930 RepID=A0A2N9EF83_FAGSY
MVMWALETKLVQPKGNGSPWLLGHHGMSPLHGGVADDISQKETKTELLLDDDTLAKAANYISMGENAGKLGGVLHSDGSVGPKETANRLLNSMKLTGKDDMAIFGDSGVCTDNVKGIIKCMSGEADDAKHGKEHNRKRKLSHFDELLYYIILEYWCCDDTNSTVNIRTRQDPRGPKSPNVRLWAVVLVANLAVLDCGVAEIGHWVAILSCGG